MSWTSSIPGAALTALEIVVMINVVIVAVSAAGAFAARVLPVPAHRPPAVTGCTDLSARRVVLLWWWARGGYWHGARRGSLLDCLLLGWWLLAPALLLAQVARSGYRGTRYYFSPTGDAVLAVTVHRTRWMIEDHLTAAPGTGQGKALRALVFPVLQAHADQERLAIATTAVTAGLAWAYQQDLPGLGDVGRGFPRGRKLRRDPA